MEMLQVHSATVTCDADVHINVLKDVLEEQCGGEPSGGLDETAGRIDGTLVASKA